MLCRPVVLVWLTLAACGNPIVVASPEPSDAGQQLALDGGEAPVDAGLDAGAPDAGRGPPYPIVLAHGFFGFDSFAGLDFLTYYFEVKDALVADGELEVFTPTVDPFNDSATRSAQLERQIEAILASTGAAKVNVIAHSQGGLDTRLVANRRPELISSVITVSTPHHGTPVSDLVARGLQDPRARAAVDAIINIAAPSLWSDATKDSSITAALAQFETSRMADFNARVVDRPGVRFFSVAGRSALRRVADTCDADDGTRPPFIRTYDGTLDPVSPMLDATEFIISPNVFDPVGNDGLVPVESAKWGTFLGCIPADHLDEIGQIGGLSPGLGNDWRHKPFYRSLVTFLRQRGY
ncbi:MAG: triacylglycerol lipase [Archangium sp.]|nr:triacylglycerol lipase [Archangium sp.]MDP3576187.1 triacylglycerol lipase [Archangium sp.]